LIIKFRDCGGSVIVNQDERDGAEWIHASIAWTDRMPTYEELVMLKAGVFGDRREAYQVFPPASRHVNIHAHALHLGGGRTGSGCCRTSERRGPSDGRALSARDGAGGVHREELGAEPICRALARAGADRPGRTLRRRSPPALAAQRAGRAAHHRRSDTATDITRRSQARRSLLNPKIFNI
jgi:hypothetical protein